MEGLAGEGARAVDDDEDEDELEAERLAPEPLDSGELCTKEPSSMLGCAASSEMPDTSDT